MFFSFVPSLARRRPEPAAARAGQCSTLLALCFSLLLGASSASAGTWTQLVNSNPEFYSSTMLLLTDGSVMVHSAYDYQTWTKLTPDSTGSYVNGTWTTLAPMSIPRQNFGSIVLPDGRVMVLGGEFSGQSLTRNNTNSGEIYDPVTNKWKGMTAFPEATFGAGPVALLQYGYVIAGSPTTDQTYIYYPPGDYWFSFGGSISGGEPKLRGDLSAQETWLVMPDGSVMTYDIYSTAQTSNPTAQRFSLNSFTWIDSGTIPFALTGNAQLQKMGPGAILPNGKLFQVGGNELTVLYTPSNTTNGIGTWNTAPSLPAGYGADDAPGAMLPDGHFYFIANSYPGNNPSQMFDYDYRVNTLTNITNSLPFELQFYLTYYTPGPDCRMLILPNGTMLLSIYYDLWQFQPSDVPLDPWRPTIASISKSTPSRYTVLGARLSGISEGATFGNEARMSTNYPLVKLAQVGVTRYARTTNWTPIINRPGSNSLSQFNFDVPTGLTPGTYQLSVVANGIQSLSQPITIAPSRVTASFSGGTLNINGDDDANSFSVTYKQVKQSGVLTGATVTITATDSFTLINGQQSVVLQVGIDRFNVNAQLGGGNDTVTFNSLFSKGMIANLGDGDDTATFLYNTYSTQLYIDGGLGFDSVTLTGNSVPKLTTVNVP